MPTLCLCVDFGSTYTKLALVDVDAASLVARSMAPTTPRTDLSDGLASAWRGLLDALGRDDCPVSLTLACSSAKGGLRMVAIGLAPDLTAEAARRAALGAGAKVSRVFSYELTRRDVAEIESLAPDIVLLAGGTDGGNRSVVTGNARALGAACLTCPVVFAGNRAAAEEVAETLASAGKPVYVTDNVMPEFGELKVEPAREVIRQIFMEHIVVAKGLDRVRGRVGAVLMPTPAAVLRAAELLAAGTADEPGVGPLVVVDVGGATTDVHSVASGEPSESGRVRRGLPEPYAKRTVEGDLGIRHNAPAIVELLGGCRAVGAEVAGYARRVAETPAHLPATPAEQELDAALARAAVDAAMERHAGRLDTFYTAVGPTVVQTGKDLTNVGRLIGLGGVFAFGSHPRRVLEGALFDPSRPFTLRPKSPTLWVDEAYVFYAAGLLAGRYPSAAVRLLKRHLREV